MSYIRQLIGNQCLVASVLSWMLSQLLKFVLTAFSTGKFESERLWGSGGMPSAHAATVCTLATSVAIVYGLDCAEFALSSIFALVVMYDACGVRLEVGRHSKRLNELSSIAVQSDNTTDVNSAGKLKPFHDHVGHSLPQVMVGGVIGVLMAFIIARVYGSI